VCPAIAKKTLSDLALFGGVPAFREPLHVGRPNIGDRERLLARINEILDNRWLTNNGPFVQELEARLANYLGVRHCIAMCNGTVATEIAIRALGLSGEVIVPSMTFVATAHSLQWQEITPIFCDIEPGGYNIDPERIEDLITPRTTGIIGVHLWGHPCAVERLAEVAARHGLKLLYDAAHAFGCSYHGRMIGNFGDAEILSFHATKFFNTFEGGAVVTNNDELAAKIRLMKNFGFAGVDRVIYIGINGKMSEVSAAMGLTGLESLDEFVEANRAHYQQYKTEFSGVSGIQLLEFDETQKSNYQYIVLEIDEDVAGISRDQLVDVLWAENVRARRYFYPGCHRMEPYRSLYPWAGKMLARTEYAVDRVMTLPTGLTVSSEDIHRICKIVSFVVMHASEIGNMSTRKAAYR
jgi:dTDP-4-amino-4,6-dideoxygalactose transaminase